MENKKISQLVRENSNNYAHLERIYYENIGTHLVVDPYNSVKHVPKDMATVSIIIPAWNVDSTIISCLVSIEQSSFNLKYNESQKVDHKLSTK